MMQLSVDVAAQIARLIRERNELLRRKESREDGSLRAGNVPFRSFLDQARLDPMDAVPTEELNELFNVSCQSAFGDAALYEAGSRGPATHVLTLNFVCDDLRVVNRTVQDIESDPHVNFCTVNTAATNDNYNNIYADGGVNARIMVYLNPAEEVTRP